MRRNELRNCRQTTGLPREGQGVQIGRIVPPSIFRGQKPSESRRPWDYYKQLAIVPATGLSPSAKGHQRLPLTQCRNHNC